MIPTRQIFSQYLSSLGALLEKIDPEAVERTVEHLRAVRDLGGTVYVAGNGGSAATGSHWVNDLGKATKLSGCPAFRVVSLSDNVAWLTALANDEGYERVFAGQLENFARPNDSLVVISASGNSPNLVRAVELARSRGVTTIGLLGFNGGRLKEMVDVPLWLPTEQGCYEVVEDGHMVLCHILTICLTKDRPSADSEER
jgi:D-sedoheptulose 7-phosphate isomerase